MEAEVLSAALPCNVIPNDIPLSVQKRTAAPAPQLQLPQENLLFHTLQDLQRENCARPQGTVHVLSSRWSSSSRFVWQRLQNQLSTEVLQGVETVCLSSILHRYILDSFLSGWSLELQCGSKSNTSLGKDVGCWILSLWALWERFCQLPGSQVSLSPEASGESSLWKLWPRSPEGEAPRSQ